MNAGYIEKRVLPYLIILVATFIGCSNRPKLAEVKGRVTVDGKPLKTGTIQFWPDEEGRQARGEIDEDGYYSLTTFDSGDGAMLGSHRVTITATKIHGDAPDVNSLEEELEFYNKTDAKPFKKPIIEWLAPKRYSNVDTTDLVKVVEKKTNTIDIDLPAE